MIKTITAAPVERDAHGFWTHPDYFVPANGNEFGVEGEFDAWKALNRVVGTLDWMDCDENAEELQAAYDAGDCDLSMWQPKPPAGDGWFMASIHDTEDGPVCYWLRPIECDPKALAIHFDNCYAEAFKTEHLVAERDAALNTCSLIAEALGITGAVAGDTIAKVYQLVGENAVLTDKAASELSNAWLLHKYWVGIQAALMHMHVGRINEATEWLVGTVSGPGFEAPNLKLTDEIEDWAEIQQKDTISHAQALEIIKAEMSASTQAISEIKTQSRIESTYFTANRLLAAFEHGFIDKPEKEVADMALMILESAKYMPSAQPEEFTKTYSDQVLASIAASLREGRKG